MVAGPICRVVGVPGGLLKSFSQVCHCEPSLCECICRLSSTSATSGQGQRPARCTLELLPTGAVQDKPLSLKHRNSVSEGFKMSYFVTGGTGFIGRNLIDQLLRRKEIGRASCRERVGLADEARWVEERRQGM